MRTHLLPNTQHARRRQGFTLVEVLVAIVILLVGVVAALRIFPRGYDAYVGTQSTYAALGLLDKTVNEFTEHPEAVPDAIYPIDPDGSSAIIGQFDFADLGAVDYRGSTATAWYSKLLYPGADGVRWPLMEPLGLRAMRRVEGERCRIPSEITGVTTGSSAYNFAFLPKYFPSFGPVQMGSSADTFVIYDVRYRTVSEEQLAHLRGRMAELPDTLYYTADYQRSRLVLLPDDDTRCIRTTFYAKNATTGAVAYVYPQQITLPAADGISFQTTTPAVTIDAAVTSTQDDCRITLQGGWRIIPGSEQLNRAYRPVLTKEDGSRIDLGNIDDYQYLANLKSGCYFIEMPPEIDGAYPPGYETTNMLWGAIYFSKQDAGKTVKIDYTVADWNILHEDVTVDDDGYFRLSVPDPKIRNVPAFPREPRTWGLYGPMRDGSTVMGLVNLRTGVQYHINVDKPEKRTPTYTVKLPPSFESEQEREKVPNRVTGIDMGDAQRGQMRLGGVDEKIPDWQALCGETFRVFYRARRDWTLQVFRAPALFGYTSNPDGLGWKHFSQDGTMIYVPSVYEGQSVAVDYQYREELCRVTERKDSTDTLTVTGTDRLKVGMQIRILNPKTVVATGAAVPAADQVKFAEVVAIPTATTVTVTDAIRVEVGAVVTNAEAPLLQANGEMHVIPQRTPSRPAVSQFKLQHFPEPNTATRVRGVSVTVRALWTQPSAGKAYIIDTNGKWESRELKERWQGKSVTVVLPATKE